MESSSNDGLYALVKLPFGMKKIFPIKDIYLKDENNEYNISATLDLLHEANFGAGRTLRVFADDSNEAIACVVQKIDTDRDTLQKSIDESEEMGRGKRKPQLKRQSFSPAVIVKSKKLSSNASSIKAKKVAARKKQSDLEKTKKTSIKNSDKKILKQLQEKSKPVTKHQGSSIKNQTLKLSKNRRSQSSVNVHPKKDNKNYFKNVVFDVSSEAEDNHFEDNEYEAIPTTTMTSSMKNTTDDLLNILENSSSDEHETQLFPGKSVYTKTTTAQAERTVFDMSSEPSNNGFDIEQPEVISTTTMASSTTTSSNTILDDFLYFSNDESNTQTLLQKPPCSTTSSIPAPRLVNYDDSSEVSSDDNLMENITHHNDEDSSGNKEKKPKIRDVQILQQKVIIKEPEKSETNKNIEEMCNNIVSQIKPLIKAIQPTQTSYLKMRNGKIEVCRTWVDISRYSKAARATDMRKRCNGITEAIWPEKEDRARLFVWGRHCKDATVLTDQHYEPILCMCRELQVHKVFPFNNENDPILDVKAWVSNKLKTDRHRFLRSRNNNAFFEQDGEDSDLITDVE